MISLCSNVNGLGHNYLEYYKESILRNTKHISEVLLCDIDEPNDFYHEEEIRGIKFKRFGHPAIYPVLMNKKVKNCFKPTPDSDVAVEAVSFGHAFGLDEAIKRATNDYIYTCDPDTIFFGPAEETYMDLMNKHDIKFIGASHHISVLYSTGYFPNPVNFMTKKSYLPPSDFFAGKFKMKHAMNGISGKDSDAFDEFLKDKFFFQGNIPEFTPQMPNPSGVCDTGVNLYIWSEHIKARWLGFQTDDCHTYTTKYFRTNFGLKANLGRTKMFWHATGGQADNQPYWDDFVKTWEAAKSEEED